MNASLKICRRCSLPNGMDVLCAHRQSMYAYYAASQLCDNSVRIDDGQDGFSCMSSETTLCVLTLFPQGVVTEAICYMLRTDII